MSFRIDAFYDWTQSRSITAFVEQDHIRNRATAIALVTEKPRATVEPNLSPASTLGSRICDWAVAYMLFMPYMVTRVFDLSNYAYDGTM